MTRLTRSQEGAENVITLLPANGATEPDNGGDDPDIVKLMVKYFYTLDYAVPRDVSRFGATSDSPSSILSAPAYNPDLP